jgi:queuosine precursor transporter
MFAMRKIDSLVALYIFGVMIAQVMSAKTFPIVQANWLHLNASVAIFVMPLLFTITDVVNEVYGRKRARSLVRIGLMVVVLQVLAALLFTSLPASTRFTGSEPAYDMIVGTSIRFGLAGIAAFAASELLDVLVFSRLRQWLGKSKLWLRNNASNFVSQFVDAAVWTTLAFWAFDQPIGSNITFIASIVLPYWLLRCALSVTETPLVYLGVWWLRLTKPKALASGTEAAKA